MNEEVGSAPVEEGVIQTAPQPAPEPQRAPASAPPTITQGPASGQENPGINPPNEKIDLGSEAFQKGYQAEQIQPNRWQDLGNRAAIAAEGSTLGQRSDWLGQYGAQKENESLGVTKISPEEANKKFPGMPEAFSKPIDPTVARLQYDRYQSMKLRQQWAMHGGEHPWEDFALGVGMGVVDPVNVVLGMMTGGVGELAGVAESAGNSFLKNLAISGAKNAAIGGGLGVASYQFEKSQHTNPDMGSAIEFGIEQTLGMSIVHAGYIKLFGRAEELQKQMPKDLQNDALRNGVATEEAGGKIDATPQALEAQSRAKGEMEGRASPYRFQDLDHPSQRPFYTAVDAAEKPIRMAPGEGVTHASDNPVSANHLAGEGGKVGEFQVPKESKFVRSDEPIPEDLQKAFSDAIAKTGEEIDPEALKEIPTGDVLKALANSHESGSGPSPELVQAMKEAGYAGIQYTAHDESGRPVHNGLALFDHPDLSRIFKADPELAKGFTADQKQAFLDDSMGRENSKTLTPEIQEDAHEFNHEAPLNSTDDYLDPIIEENMKLHEQKLMKRAETDPSVKAALEDIKKSDVQDSQEKQAAKDFADCVTGGLT